MFSGLREGGLGFLLICGCIQNISRLNPSHCPQELRALVTLMHAVNTDVSTQVACYIAASE